MSRKDAKNRLLDNRSIRFLKGLQIEERKFFKIGRPDLK